MLGRGLRGMGGQDGFEARGQMRGAESDAGPFLGIQPVWRGSLAPFNRKKIQADGVHHGGTIRWRWHHHFEDATPPHAILCGLRHLGMPVGQVAIGSAYSTETPSPTS